MTLEFFAVHKRQ